MKLHSSSDLLLYCKMIFELWNLKSRWPRVTHISLPQKKNHGLLSFEGQNTFKIYLEIWNYFLTFCIILTSFLAIGFKVSAWTFQNIETWFMSSLRFWNMWLKLHVSADDRETIPLQYKFVNLSWPLNLYWYWIIFTAS